MRPIVYFYMFMTALFAALIMVPQLTRWALASGTVDTPDARKVHTEAVPRIGGVAIFMSFILAILIYVDITPEIRGIMAGGLVMFLTGLIDDLQGLRPAQKLLGQTGAVLVAMSIGRIHIDHLGDLFGMGNIVLPIWIGVPFTVFAVVGLTNAINLIDGLDGLAGGVATIALLAFFALAWHDGNQMVMTLCACLLGAIFGFLKYNIYPARIFMGDAGSLTIGFLLAMLAILLTQGTGRGGIPPVVPLIVLALPITDTLWVMLRRISKRINPFTPDRGHVHHKFLDLGFQHRFTVIIIYGISFLIAASALTLHDLSEHALLLAHVAGLVLIFLLLRYVVRHKERFSILSTDSAKELRNSVTFERLSAHLRFLSTFITLLIGFYLLVSAWIVLRNEIPQVWPLSVMLLAGTVWMISQARGKTTSPFLHALLFFSLEFISVLVERSGQRPLLEFSHIWHQDAIVNSVFIALLPAIFLRIIFSDKTSQIFNGIDFLLLGATIVLMPLFPPTGIDALSMGTIFKGALLFIGLKVVALHESSQSRILIFVIQGILLLIALLNLGA